MAEAKSKPKRTYNSRRRVEQARQTRRQIVEAARGLFISRGYAGATIDAIAQQAGVAVETVYAAFGSKRAILAQLVELSVGGDEQPVPLLQRPEQRLVLQGIDQHWQIGQFADGISRILSRAAPIVDVVRVAAKTEPEIAGMYTGILDARLRNLTVFVRSLRKNGPLRSGVTLETAAETVWTLTSPEAFLLLTSTRGWAREKYVHWLADALERLLLP